MAIQGNFCKVEKIKNKCSSLAEKSKQEDFKNINTKENRTRKAFWDAVKPFMSNKYAVTNDDICVLKPR